MQTDVSNVLSDLITLSDNADQIIADSNLGNDQLGQWISLIKQTATAIVEDTYCRASTSTEKSSCFSKEDLPSLVTLIKGKQNPHHVKVDIHKDNRARLSHRKSRKSLRKIVLGKSRSNQWKISSRKSSVKTVEIIPEDEDTTETTTPIPKVKDKLLEFSISANKSQHSKSYFSELDSASKITPQVEFCTPIQKKEIFSSNTDKTPVTRSKLKTTAATTKVVKAGGGNISFSSQNSLMSETKSPVEKTSSQPAKSNSSVFERNQGNEFLTPGNETITIDSDSSSGKDNYITPITRSKRKSSVQHTQENAKRIKSTKTSQVLSGKQNQGKWEDNFTGNNAFKKMKLAKDLNSVIPAKNLHQQNQTHPEKRILREIQKKEEKVSQNAEKLRSLKKRKIEENKKAREKKMEKAMQQRMKIEKEKEERFRSRTQSKQETLQQTESVAKKGAQKNVEPAGGSKSSEKILRSPVKKVRISPVEQKSSKHDKNLEVNKTYIYDPSPKEIANTNALNNLNATYVHIAANVENNSSSSSTNEKPPPKPIRNVKKANEISNKKNTSDFENDKNPLKEIVKKPLYESSTKDSASNSTFSVNSSTPATKKVESKINMVKTPVLNNAKKPNSYVMTPHENSFVSYDISEIKSDDSDEEESIHQKPIPSWAQGINLRTALLKQHYTPIDIESLFGNCFTPPKLPDIMGMEKKHYHKRTSSAIWLESPNRSRSYYT